MSPFVVRLEVYEGPLDLLLTLVRRESLEITTVALAKVTNQYLAYMAALEEIDPGALAAFCEVAATLILIKSRALLPRGRAAADEEDADSAELAERLREYRRFRAVGDRLGRRERAGLRAYVRTAPPPPLPKRLDPGDVRPEDLAKAFQAALAEATADEEALADASLVRPHPVRLSERLVDIRGLLLERRRVSFREVLATGRLTREYVIVSFLAVLELLRRRGIRAVQDELFGDIRLEALPGLADVDFSALAHEEGSLFDEPAG